MRSPLNIEDFDNYLEEEVNQHRMYPSDHVWRNIQQELHGYKKWPALTVITLFVISALVVGTLLMKPHKLAVGIMAANASKATAEPVEKNPIPKENLQQHLSPDHITEATIAAVTSTDDIDAAIQDAFAQYHNIPELPAAAGTNDNSGQVIAAITNTDGSYVAAAQQKINGSGVSNALANKTNNIVVPQAEAAINASLKKQADALAKNYNGYNWMRNGIFDSQAPNRFYYSKGIWKTVYGSILFSSARNLHSAGSPDFYNVAFSNVNPSKTGKNKFKLQSKSNRFDIQLFVTPSFAYRTISYGKSKANSQLAGIPNGAGYIVNVSELVANKPTAGYEGGVAIGYKLNNNLTLRAGLQFNEREYDFSGSIPGPTGADNAVAANNSNTGGAADVNAQSAAGTKQQPPVVFTNRYYQASIPIGIDWKAWKRGKFSVGLATSLAPSYTFSKAPFIVASDKSVNGLNLMRNWNINSTLETYFAYTTGKFKWQIGPQVRYQFLSTLNGNYPVNEHLIDYGIKIGVTRSLP